MKRIVVFFALFLALVQVANAEVDLEIVWKRYMYETQTYIDFAKFSADGNYVYCAVNGNIQVLDASNGKFTTVFKNDSVSGIYEMQISKAGNLILTRDGGGAVNLWDVKQEKAIRYLPYKPNNQNGGVYSADISPDEKYLILGLAFESGPCMALYDIQLGKEVKRVNIIGHPNKIKYSNDGNSIAVGMIRYDNDGNEYDRLSLYDTETLKEVTIVQDVEGGDGYRKLKYSLNNQYLIYLRNVLYLGAIYNINKKNNIINSNMNMDCLNIELLPDNYHYLADYYLGNSTFYLELSNFDKKIKKYSCLDAIIETYGTADNWKIFYGGGNDTFYLFKNTETDVKANEENTRTFSVNYLNDILKLFFDEIPSNNFDLTIYDLTGKIIYTHKFDNISSDGIYNINLILPTGIYICNIKTENKEYSQKFEVVR